MDWWNRRISRRLVLRGSAAAVMLAATSLPPRTIAAAGVAADAGPLNIRVSNDGFDGHGEPWVAVNPCDPRNLVGACMVFRGVLRGLATYASFDGGRTWLSNGLLPGLQLGFAADVTVAFDRQGHGFVSGLVGSSLDVRVWRTEDGGRSFLQSIVAAPGLADHPWLAASPTSTSELYVAWLSGRQTASGLAFSRSRDGGRSFEAPRILDRRGTHPMTAAGPDGMLGIAYQVFPADGSTVATVLLSEDHGQTFGEPVELSRASLAVRPPGGFVVNPRSGPAIAIGPEDGDVFVADASLATTTDPNELRFFSSHDRGRTWASPVSLARSQTVIYLQPQVAVDHEGRVGVSVFALANGWIDLLLFLSEPERERFGPPLTVTSQQFDARLGERAGGVSWIGDYQGLVATADAFHPFWNDTRTGEMEIFAATVRTRR